MNSIQDGKNSDTFEIPAREELILDPQFFLCLKVNSRLIKI